eukprot:Skav227752  [mRNA]  locus=scaffold3513:572094:589131:- [translate_table: standard]
MGRGAYINGRYVANATKGSGKGGRGWTGDDEPRQFQRKPGDEDVDLERKFDVDILQPGETRRGYLFNMKNTRHYDEGGRSLSGLLLYFYQRDGRTFRCTFLYRPYFFVQVRKGGAGYGGMDPDGWPIGPQYQISWTAEKATHGAALPRRMDP